MRARPKHLFNVFRFYLWGKFYVNFFHFQALNQSLNWHFVRLWSTGLLNSEKLKTHYCLCITKNPFFFALDKHIRTQLNVLTLHEFSQLSGQSTRPVFGRSWVQILTGLRFFLGPSLELNYFHIYLPSCNFTITHLSLFTKYSLLNPAGGWRHVSYKNSVKPCIRRLSPQNIRQSKVRCPTETTRKQPFSSPLAKIKTMIRLLWPLLIINQRIPGLI